MLANSRGNGSMSNFTFCILYRKILVFAYIPSIVSCKTNLDLLLMRYWYALMAETALPVHCNKKMSSTDLQAVAISLIFRAQTTFYFDILDQNVAIGAESLGFDSRIGQIGHSIANGSPPLRRFLKG